MELPYSCEDKKYGRRLIVTRDEFKFVPGYDLFYHVQLTDAQAEDIEKQEINLKAGQFLSFVPW